MAAELRQIAPTRGCTRDVHESGFAGSPSGGRMQSLSAFSGCGYREEVL